MPSSNLDARNLKFEIPLPARAALGDPAWPAQADASAYADFFWKLLESGVYTAPSQFETNFTNWAHTPEDLKTAGARFAEAIATAARQRAR